ncbi:MAG: isopentenyl-diphosphate Delta-isomerase [bacterium]
MTLTIERSAAPRTERVILVEADDRAIGSSEKLAAHHAGLLHRACSVFVFNHAGELLMQRRAPGKYHSAGLWSNSCCGHPRPREGTVRAARRRLREEMGIDCPLEHATAIVYRASLGDGLFEYEYDHIFVGRSDATPAPDPAEADAYAWRDLATLLPEMRDHRERFTTWFGVALSALVESGSVDAVVAERQRAAIRQTATEIVSPYVTLITVIGGAGPVVHQGGLEAHA